MLGPNDPRVLRLKELQRRGELSNANGGLQPALANGAANENRYIQELQEKATNKKSRREALRNPAPISPERIAELETVRQSRAAAEAKRNLRVSQPISAGQAIQNIDQQQRRLTPTSLGIEADGVDEIFEKEKAAYGEAQAKRLLKVRNKRKSKAQQASLVEQKNSQYANNVLVEQALEPWENYVRSGTDPSFHNRNQQEWVNHQNRIMDVARERIVESDIHKINPNNPDVQYLIDQIRDLSPDLDDNRIYANLNRALAGLKQGRDAITKELAYNEPGAAADEKLGLGALALSGFDDLSALNRENPFATDLSGRFAGQRLLIDSQKMRGQNNMSIGALMNVETAADLDAFLRSDPGRSVLESLQILQRGQMHHGVNVGFADEGKIMQTMNSRFNPNPSARFSEEASMKAKDALLLSERGGYVPNDPLFRDGPYNATQAEGLYLMDLNALREMLGNTNYDGLLSKGADLYSKPVPRQRRDRERAASNRGNQLYDVALSLPRSIATNMQGDLPGISEEALRRFVL